MESLRRYVTDNELYERGVSSITTFQLIQAERDIDTVLNNFYEGKFAPIIQYVITKEDCVFTTAQVTLPNDSTQDNYYDYTALEITTGVNKGTQIALSTSTNGVVQFANTQTITPGTYNCKIWQEGKFPRNADYEIQDNSYNKSIPVWIKDAVAYQYLFRVNNANLFNNPYPTKSYTVRKDEYSEQYDTTSEFAFMAQNRISPDAMSILSDKGVLGLSV